MNKLMIKKDIFPETKKIGKKTFEETIKLVEKVEKKIESMGIEVKEDNDNGYIL